MLKVLISFVLMPLSIFSCSLQLVIQDLGRLGDHIVALMTSQWLAERYDLELVLFKDFFPNSVEEVLGYELISFKDYQMGLKGPIGSFECFNEVLEDTRSCECSKKRTYKVAYMFALNFFKRNKDIHLNEFGFLSRFREKFQEIEKKYEIIKPPRDWCSIACHMVEDKNFDNRTNQLKKISSFTSLEFHYRGIETILKEIPPDYPVFIGVFSDSVSLDFMEDLNNYVKKFSHKVVLKYMTDSNKEQLVDIFQMSHYDFIIRGTSHFSCVSSLLGNPIGSYTYFERGQPPRLEFEKKRLYKKLKSIF